MLRRYIPEDDFQTGFVLLRMNLENNWIGMEIPLRKGRRY
jgi:hypothetical protein